ncbi:TauD/TfdA family dioxygenase [Catenulispora rubra]|uniref:TauD/TfdA family dioxygenase n=1 Tax=Catenulispora rubra TaxID=280293 RepID=UPI0018924944|nr:TauD/TfdA family dioxygenase [Catenulispora rubra]
MDLVTARRELRDQGWTVVRKLPFLVDGRVRVSGVGVGEEVDRSAVLALALAAEFGRPSRRDGGAAVWPVQPAADGNGSTFSVTAGEAGLHTDSQYHANPEPLVCMFAVRPAEDGGHTRLLTAADAASALAKEPDSSNLLHALAAPVWQWRVPREFAAGDRTVSPASAVLPGDGTIRWRADNVVWRHGGPAPQLVARVAHALDTAPEVRTFPLEAGDALILDNRRVLHGRTSFADPRRLLLRVRLWER